MEKPTVKDVLVIARHYVNTNKTSLHMVLNNKNIKDDHSSTYFSLGCFMTALKSVAKGAVLLT
ncbi:hypothetical protein ACFLJZ_003031 [Vibrio alginolyticus]